jgi:hypothetical protein
VQCGASKAIEAIRAYLDDPVTSDDEDSTSDF